MSARLSCARRRRSCSRPSPAPPRPASRRTTSPDITLTPPPGWSLTPAMGVSQTWDDNVTLKGPGDNPVSDIINVVNPRAELNFNGSRGQLAARYDGAFLLYRSSHHAQQLRPARIARREAQTVQPHGVLHQRGRHRGADDGTAAADGRAVRPRRRANRRRAGRHRIGAQQAPVDRRRRARRAGGVRREGAVRQSPAGRHEHRSRARSSANACRSRRR